MNSFLPLRHLHPRPALPRPPTYSPHLPSQHRTTPPPSTQQHHRPNPQQRSAFSTSTPLSKRERVKPDKRVTLIRYHLSHGLTPRPLRFSRLRALRHWTIHRAWQLYQAQQRASRERELERFYNSMRDACEDLRCLEVGDGRYEKSPGNLFRRAMHKRGVWEGWPIEASRAQTEWPSVEGWSGDWVR